MATHHLVLGGARSGKSHFAEQYVIERAIAAPIYLATATATDSEMQARIENHQRQRDRIWRSIEEPLDLAKHILQLDSDQIMLVDCLTLWVNNCLHADEWPRRKRAFLEALNGCSASLVMVSNEVGAGVVPIGRLSRLFVDEIGWLHQTLAQHCHEVTLITAGLPQPLKK